MLKIGNNKNILRIVKFEIEMDSQKEGCYDKRMVTA